MEQGPLEGAEVVSFTSNTIKMSQVGTRRVVLHSAPDQSIKTTNGETLTTQTYKTDDTPWPALHSGNKYPTGEIVFKANSDKTPSDYAVNATKTSTQVIGTHHSNGGEPTEVTIQMNPVVTTSVCAGNNSKKDSNNVDRNSGTFDTGKRGSKVYQRANITQAPTFSQMKSVRYSPIDYAVQKSTANSGQDQEDGSYYAQISKTSVKIGSKTNYTYKLQGGVAVLENVTRHPAKTNNNNNILGTQESRKKSEDQKELHQKEYLLTNRKPYEATRIEHTVRDQTPKQGTDGIYFQKRTQATAQTPAEKVRSEQARPTNKLQTTKIQFLQKQDKEPDKPKRDSTPTKLVKPDYATQHTSITVREVSPTTKVEKRNVNQWMMQTTKQEEMRTQMPPSLNKLSADKVQFLQNRKLEKGNVASPGRLVIPEFSQHNSTTEVQEVVPPPKVDKQKTEQWITQTIKQEELRTKLPTPQKNLSADKVQFLHTQQQQSVEKLHMTSPGRLVIPEFSQHSSTTEVQEVSPPPKVEKRNAEQWMTETRKQDELRSEQPPPPKKLSTDKVQFLHLQEQQSVEKVNVSSPGRLVIPEFTQHSSTIEVQEVSPPPRVEKRNAEQWIIQTTNQEELRSELPPPPNKLSSHKIHFLQTQEKLKEERVNVSSPDRLVIPEFSQHSSTTEVQEVVPNPKVEKRKKEQWITQTIKEEELRTELPPPPNKLSTEKIHFLQTQEKQKEERVNVLSPGRLVIPEFSQQSSTTEVQEVVPPPKVEKRKTGQWITQTTEQEELQSELPPPPNKLSADKVQFLQSEEKQKVENVKVTSRGWPVIPESTQHSSTMDVQQVSPSSKVEKRNAEQWIIQTTNQEQLRSELPPPPNKLSADKVQFLHNQEQQSVEKVNVSSPGRLVIPEFSQHSSTTEVQEVVPPPKVEKRKIEQWITQTIKKEELRSELPPPPKKLSTDKVQFLHSEEQQKVENIKVTSPGRLVIPEFGPPSSTIEVQEMDPPPKVEKRKTKQWITQTLKQEELRSELPPPPNKLSADKVQFLHTQEQQNVEKVNVSSPRRLVIPEFTQHSSTIEVQEVSPPPKVEKLNAEQWIIQTTNQEELRSELPPPPNKLSTDKIHFLQTQEKQKEERVSVSSPGRLVIPEFSQHSSTTEVQEIVPPPKVEKRKTERWVTQTIKQEELRSELPPPPKKLSTDKVQFLHSEEQQKVENIKVTSPGRLVIPEFGPPSSTIEVQEMDPPPKVEKQKTKQWITQTIKQEELRSELPPPPNKLSADKVQFLHTQEQQNVEKVNVSSPGRLVIPEFTQHSSTIEVQEVSPLPKVEKLNAEQWIIQSTNQEELNTELPPPPNKLSTDKIHFLQTQEKQKEERVSVSSPGRLVIPEFSQHRSTTEVQEVVPPPKVEKKKTERWITQTIKQEELRSELPPPPKKLSTDKVQFLHSEEQQKVENIKVTSPGRLVITEFGHPSSTIEVQEVVPPPKVDKRKTEQWITQTITQNELRSELPPPPNKLSADKVQFLHTQEQQNVEKVNASSPGRLVIPEFTQHSSTIEVQEVSPPPKVEKLNAEQWIIQTTNQEELRSELPPPPNKLSADIVQFLHHQEQQSVEKVNVSSPSRLVIPEFSQHSSTTEVQEMDPPPKVEKRKTEQWITQTIKQEELRSELPPPPNKLSADKVQFLHTQEQQNVEKVNVSSPGRLVIPEFTQHSSTIEVQEVSPLPKVEKLNAEQWIIQSTNQEELNTELPPPPNKLSTDKIHFLQTQEKQKEERVSVSSPGRLVIPEFSQHRSTTEVQEIVPPPKVEKKKTERWITQTIKQEELRSELPPPPKKLSTDKVQFLHSEEQQKVENIKVTSPGRLVITEFGHPSSTIEVQEVVPPPKVDKRKTEQWITQTITQDELRSELPPPPNKLSADKVQFLHTQEQQNVEKVNASSPGRLVIPEFTQHSSTIEVQEVSPPPKVEKLNVEQWIIQTTNQEELRSELPPPPNKLSADIVQFLHHQEQQSVEKVNVSSPGRLVIPEFSQHSSTTEVQEMDPPPKVEKRKTEQWITQTIKQEELRSELPPPPKKLSTDKVQFLHSEEQQKVENIKVTSPGRLVITEFGHPSSTIEVQEVVPPPKVDKRKTEQWITQTITQDELRSELPPPPNKLSADKVQFLHTQEQQNVEKVNASSPGRLVIPEFTQHSSTIEVQEVSPPPKVEKLNAEQWIIQTTNQEELRSELPPPPNKLSADIVQFLHHQEQQSVEKVNVSSPGRLVIPEFSQHSSTTEVQEVVPPPKVEKRKIEQWIAQTIKQEELRSELPPPPKKLSTDKVQFLHSEEQQKVENIKVTSPGRLVIPEFGPPSSTIEVQEMDPPPKVEKRKTKQWITQTLKQEELRSELPPPPNKLSADKVQFLHTQEQQNVEKVNVSSPGRLVIPEVTQHSSTIEVQEVSPPPKVEKLNAEQWIIQTTNQEELNTELPPPPNKLSTDKIHFLQTQEKKKEERVSVSSPGRLVIPEFSQHSSTTEVQEVVPPPKVERKKTERWIPQTINQEELRSELPPTPKKLSTDKVQFLHSEEQQKVENIKVTSPGRLVIPEFGHPSSTNEVQEVVPPTKVDKRKTEQWITQTITQDELRSELPPPPKKLSADKVQFLHTQEEQNVEKVNVSSPRRLVIPEFTQHSSTIEVQEVSPLPKVEKRNAEQWIIQTTNQEDLNTELPPPPNKLSTDKIHFLQTQEKQKEERVNVSSPGRLVIPEFSQHSSTTEVQEVVPPPKVEKRKTEQWIMQTIKQEELRSELPPPPKKLSAEKAQFLHTQEQQSVEKIHVSSPGRLVIPEFSQDSSTIEVQEVSPPPKVKKRNAEQWITQTRKQDELRSEQPPPPKKHSTDKVQFLHLQEQQNVEKVNVSSPGRLVIPEFTQHSSTIEVQEVSPPPKVEKRNAEQWIIQTTNQEELNTELPTPPNKLSTDKIHFLQMQEKQKGEGVNVSSPGRLVIPEFSQHSSTTEVQEVVPPPKVEKRKTEQWITRTIKQAELRSELPPPPNKLSTDKVQFLRSEEQQKVENIKVTSPGRLVIPEFGHPSSTIEVQEVDPPPKVDKRKTEQWITQTIKQEELRSELPPPPNKLSEDKVQFLHSQEQSVEKVNVSPPGRLVIPEFSQHSSTMEVQEVSPPPKVEKHNAEQWVTQTTKQDQLRFELPPPPKKLSTDKVQFLHLQEQQSVEKVNVSSPGRLVIPEFTQHSSTIEVQEVSPPPKVEKLNAEQWIIQTTNQEELNTELPTPPNKLSTDKIHFLQTQEKQKDEGVNVSSPGRLVIPEFSQHSSTTEVQEVVPPLKVEKRKTEQWITQTIKQEELRSELPPPPKKLSTDKVQFLRSEEQQKVQNIKVTSPGRLVIPEFGHPSSTIEVQEVDPPPKVDKRKTEQWITQTIKQEELRSELPPPPNKLSEDKVQFLHSQEQQSVEKVNVSSPGRLVIPEFSQHSSTMEVQEVSPPPKVEKHNAEQWVTQTTKQDQLRFELPPPPKKLSTDKVQFLHLQEQQSVEKVNVSSPGRLVIPEFTQHSSTIEVQEVSPPPKVEKLNAEQWIIQTTNQEELNTELPTPPNKLSTDKIHFLQTQEKQKDEGVNVSSPGWLVIPEFSQHSSTTEVQEVVPPPKVEKRKTEQRITQTIKQEELRSELPPPPKKLSAEKAQFLHTQEQQSVEKIHVSSPGRLVIPEFSQDSSTIEVQEVSPPPKVKKRNAEQWITQTIKQEEPRSDLPPPPKKLWSDKVQFLHNQEHHSVEKVNVSSPGRLVIPEFTQHNSTIEVEEVSPPQKVEKRNSEQWIIQTTNQEELRSELPPPPNKLSKDKIHFLKTQEKQKEERVNVSSPGRLVIPEFNQQISTIEVQEVLPPPKVEKRTAEQWITQAIKQEELRCELPPPPNKLSTDKIQFLQTQEKQKEERGNVSSPGRLVISEFKQESSTIEVQEVSPPPKVEKRNAKQWITQAIKQEELTSELPPSPNKLSADKVQLLHSEEQQKGENIRVSSPGRLVIPEFSQHSSTVEVQEVSPPPKMEKLKVEQWMTETIKQEELRTELPPPPKKLSVDKVQFLHTQEQQSIEKVHVSSPGRLVIPEFSQHSSTVNVQEVLPPPKVEKRNAEQWMTETIKQEELRSELPPPPNKLSTDKIHIVQTQGKQKEEKVNVSSPGRLVIPEFNQQGSTIEVQEVSPPPKVEKRNAEQWITQAIKQDELRSELPPPPKKLSVDKVQFLDTEEHQTVEKVHDSSPGRLVIPEFGEHSSIVEVQEISLPPKVEKRHADRWITQGLKQEELRSELPPPPNKLSADKMQFLHRQEEQRGFCSLYPGRLVIPDFTQHTSSVEAQEVSWHPEEEKHNSERLISQSIEEEELRSERAFPVRRLSADKTQFFQTGDTKHYEKIHVSSPGKIVFPDFSQHSFSVVVEETSTPRRIKKGDVEEWMTHSFTQKELRSLPLPSSSRLSADRLQFLQKQETQRDEKVNVSSPGRLIIPDFEQHTSTIEVKNVSPPPKVENRISDQWITQTIKQEELKSELPSPTNKLSAEKMEFLQNRDTKHIGRSNISPPGRLSVPDFDQDVCSIEVDVTLRPSNADKQHSVAWVTERTSHEEPKSELPHPVNKLSVEKMELAHSQEAQPARMSEGPSPGRLVIPDFGSHSFSFDVQKFIPHARVETRNTEQWITQATANEDLRSEKPPSRNKLSAERPQFAHTQETQTARVSDGTAAGKLVIPDFNQQTFSIDVKTVSPPKNVGRLNAEHRTTLTTPNEEVTPEPLHPKNKLSAEKMQFVHTQDAPHARMHGAMPGRVVIPDFNKQSSSIKIHEGSPRPKVGKLKAEEWLTHSMTREELRSLPIPSTNKLSADKVEFLQNQETQGVERVDGSSPGRLVIPKSNQQSLSVEVNEVPRSSKMEKRNSLKWVTDMHTEELKTDVTRARNKLSADKLQFAQGEEAGRISHGSSPGKIVIPDYGAHSFSIDVQEVSAPQGAKKRNSSADQWIAHTAAHEELRRDDTSSTNKFSVKKLHFVNTQDAQQERMSHNSTPGKLVIPDFSQHRTSVQVHEASPPSKVEKRNADHWMTHSMTREELRSMPLPSTNKLSADKVHFLQKQETQEVEKVDGSLPGKQVIPDYGSHSFSVEVQNSKGDKQNVQPRKAQSITNEELRSELPSSATRLSADNVQSLQTQESVKTVDRSFPGKLVIPAGFH